jgi:hypothetical protein
LDTTRIERVSYRCAPAASSAASGALLALPSPDAWPAARARVGGFDGTAGVAAAGPRGRRFRRRTGAAATGASTGSASFASSALPLSNAPLVWQPLLVDVAAVQYRAWVRQRGWTDP